ncbi:MAG: type II secretion system protein GspK, partial [Methylomonas sp.]|nr:type II secretion system protein GspK [Methylomonas sp.]
REFRSLEELQLVLGVTQAVFDAVQPFITVYSGQAEVDLRYASPQLLEILASDLKARNMDDQAVRKRLEAVSGDEVDETDSQNDAENRTYTITAEARMGDEASAGLEVVAKMQTAGEPLFQISDWKQLLQGPSLFDEAMEYPVITIQDEFRYDDKY